MLPIWSGTISFGMVDIPVQLYKASETNGLTFKLLRKTDLCPIRHARICGENGEAVPYALVVRGYEYEKDRYVTVEEEDLKRASVRKTHTIEILSFVNALEIDPRYIERPYYIEPASTGRKAYALLREALKRSQRAALGRFVLKTREHLALLAPDGDAILLHQLRFATDLRPPQDLEFPEHEDLSLRELELAERLIDHMSQPWNPEQYRDTFQDDVLRLIQAKIEGQELEVEKAPQPVAAEGEDLIVQLRRSLQDTEKKPR